MHSTGGYRRPQFLHGRSLLHYPSRVLVKANGREFFAAPLGMYLRFTIRTFCFRFWHCKQEVATRWRVAVGRLTLLDCMTSELRKFDLHF